jgi:DNA primase
VERGVVDQDFKETLRQKADIVRIVGDYVKLRKAGAQNYTGLCPFHGEKTPSFSVHATRQFFHCFGCGVSGDVFAFVQKIEGITFPEALRAVAQKLNMPLPRTSFSSPQEAQEARVRGALLEMQEAACEFFQECLRRTEGTRAREYLKERGLNEETMRKFRMGFAPDSGFLLRDRFSGKYEEELLRESGLFSWKEEERANEKGAPAAGAASAREGNGGGQKAALYSKFRNRVMFPIANDQGRIVGFTGRTLATDEKAGPKYLNSPETAIYSKSRVLFNLDLAKEAIKQLNYAILVEGQMDCISVYAAGFHNVIASSGTAFTEAQARLLGRYSKNVVVNFDPDTAGAKATERTLGLLVEEEFTIKVMTLEPGFDPDLFIRRKGAEAYGKALGDSQKYFEYLIERARTQFAVRSGEGKVKAVNYLLPHIQRVPSRIVRDELANEMAQKLGIDSAVLRQELRHAAGTRTATVKATAETQVTDAERLLLSALTSGRLMSGEEHLSARDGAEEEFDPARQARFVMTSEGLHVGRATESLFSALLAADETTDAMELDLSEADRRLLASVLMKEEEELTAERLEGAVKALRRMQLRRKLDQVQQELRSTQDRVRRVQLAEERIRLKRELSDPGPREAGETEVPF